METRPEPGEDFYKFVNHDWLSDVSVTLVLGELLCFVGG